MISQKSTMLSFLKVFFEFGSISFKKLLDKGKKRNLFINIGLEKILELLILGQF